MTVWFEAASPGPKTHALVIGTSGYRHLPETGGPNPVDRELFGLGQLQSAAGGALFVARWIRDSYSNPKAPLGTIRLLLSPSDLELREVPEMHQTMNSVDGTSAQSVQGAIEQWFEDCSSNPGNVALFYIAGHGMQQGKDEGGIVLLEDFEGRPPGVLRGALDTGNVRRAMAGEGMAQDQFYFVDACRPRPEYLTHVDAEAGVRLDEPATHAPRTNPIYYSASSGELALGQPGEGTLFSKALIECLEMRAADTAPDGSWTVTATELVGALAERVKELAAVHDRAQVTTTGGQLSAYAIHRLPGAPVVPLHVGVDPETARPVAFATVSPPEALPVVTDHPLDPPAACDVVAGIYSVEVAIRPKTPPYRDGQSPHFLARPPAWSVEVSVT